MFLRETEGEVIKGRGTVREREGKGWEGRRG